MRLDKHLTSVLNISRSKVQSLIRNKFVKVNGQIITKEAFLIKDSDDIQVKNFKLYVSRSALKLLAAIKYFKLDIRDSVVLDIGASTGGFTQVLLEHDAKKVYALDVGINQLAEILRNDPRVVSMENINIKDVSKDVFLEKINLIVMDISFISIDKVIESIINLSDQCEMIFLFKPQFEVGPENIIDGIVKNQLVVDKRKEYYRELFAKLGIEFIDEIKSPILGKDGNQEYLWRLKKSY